VADNGLLTGFKMRWTMDEITSADLLYDAGTQTGERSLEKAGGGR
jgi:ABC-type uncharacterized transport system substrate-binding protein